MCNGSNQIDASGYRHAYGQIQDAENSQSAAALQATFNRTHHALVLKLEEHVARLEADLALVLAAAGLKIADVPAIPARRELVDV